MKKFSKSVWVIASLLLIVVLFMSVPMVTSWYKEINRQRRNERSDRLFNEEVKKMEIEDNSLKAKMDLLFLKYDVNSETLKNDMIKGLYWNSCTSSLIR